MEEYWERKDIGGEIKEVWARMRCGNVGKEYNKGYKDTKCGICREEKETMEHMIICKEARKEISKEIIEEMEKWREGDTEERLKKKIEQELRGKKPLIIHCQYVRAFERYARKKENEQQAK